MENIQIRTITEGEIPAFHRNTSRALAFPMPDDYPDYLSHQMVARYLDDFVDHFGFRGRIRFRTEVTRVEPAPGGGWDVTARSRDTGAEGTARYGAVLVANGHHWDPRVPAFPGAGAFSGEQIHSHQYRGPEPFAGKFSTCSTTGLSGSSTLKM